MTGLTILDGGMGQELIHRSPAPATPLWGTQVMIDTPEIVRTVHDEFFAAGAEIATTNTYALHHDRLDQRGLKDRFVELHELACKLACDAREAHGSGRVAGALGPLVTSYLGDDGPPRDEAAALFSEIADILVNYVDILIAETVPSLARLRATLDGIEGHGKPVWIAVSVDDEDGTRLRSGEPVADVLRELEGRDVAALLVNCSIPEAVTQALTELSGAPLPLGAYANGFTSIPEAFKKAGTTVDLLSKREDLTPSAYADFAERWAGLGATIIGGCCEVSPGHIAEVARRLKGGQHAG